jgi:hypothetical protein
LNATAAQARTSSDIRTFLSVFGPSFTARTYPHQPSHFRQAVADCGQVTSGDVVPLGKKARAITGAYGLAAYDVCEELYKLALECDLWHSYAEHIRDAVEQLR